MSAITLVTTEDLRAELLHVAEGELETAGVMLASPVALADGGLRLLATGIRWCPPESYTERHETGLLITSDGYVPALAEAEASGSVALWLHTHPGEGASPRQSRHGRTVDSHLADLFRLRTGSDYYGSAVISAADGQLRFTGHLETEAVANGIAQPWARAGASRH